MIAPWGKLGDDSGLGTTVLLSSSTMGSSSDEQPEILSAMALATNDGINQDGFLLNIASPAYFYYSSPRLHGRTIYTM
ncbi:hypothetical protein SVI_1604 [Shewanella violacea DSS12]|uniref:Uncharacterized protein n=1 Tax=Shewanella violacea (strain JCM 10179 / CIP 106290 / LMG 19151 / DSS12) TaxID=637905 RepID=D4ZIS6_SHEVD|nr:hypothetical protein SVI_1604 [Shewanella violacea DSS12]